MKILNQTLVAIGTEYCQVSKHPVKVRYYLADVEVSAEVAALIGPDPIIVKPAPIGLRASAQTKLREDDR